MRPFSRIFFVLLLSTLFSACGGGDESSDDTPPVTPAPTPVADLQTIVPAPDYGTEGSFQEMMFNDINALRASFGLGLLAQSTPLDAASSNHLSYYTPSTELSNERILENPSSGSAFFTGITPQDRCIFAGYTGACPNNTQWGGNAALTDRYSALLLLTQGARQMGLSARKQLFLVTFYPFIQLGYPTGLSPQKQGPDFSLAAALGRAFHVQVNEGETLSVSSFRVWNNIGVELAGSVVTSGNDPLQRVPPYGAMFVPAELLQPCDETTYVLSFSGMRDGRPITFTKNVNFWRSSEGLCY